MISFSDNIVQPIKDISFDLSRNIVCKFFQLDLEEALNIGVWYIVKK